ncbi:MAG TPA: cell division protein CrgA [Nitriliruptorales bacterium]|nr:cell division protein CrgA [Nitriliruptorales bacterium]
MPESRHRRKGRIRPRPGQAAGPPVKPKPSPRWVAAVGVGLILVGVVVVIVNYIPGLIESNWVLVGGFVVIATGFGFLTQWR